MSFRTRLTSFFILIVVIPMLAVGFLVFRLISDSEQGKADARVNGLATAAASLYSSQSTGARAAAQTVARNSGLLTGRALHSQLAGFAAQAGLARVTLTRRGHALVTRFSALARQAGLARATLTASGRMVVDVGDKTAIAPGSALLVHPGSNQTMTVEVSELTASQYVRELSAADAAVVVRILLVDKRHEGARVAEGHKRPSRCFCARYSENRSPVRSERASPVPCTAPM